MERINNVFLLAKHAFHVLAVMALLPFFSPVLDKPKASLRQGKCYIPGVAKGYFLKRNVGQNSKFHFADRELWVCIALHVPSQSCCTLLYILFSVLLWLSVGTYVNMNLK